MSDQTTEEPQAPTPKQIRELMGCLRDHGITTDDAVYTYLSTCVDRDVTSRKDLTRVEMAKVIQDLHDHPYQGMTTERAAALRAPFPDNQIGKLPRMACRDCKDSPRKRCERHDWISRCQQCGGSHSSGVIHLDYVGHADLTDRLLSVDPNWTWRHFTQEEMLSLPPSFRETGLWIMLTVCGVTRPGFGDADGKTGGSAIKEAIGDALRNAGMRFGIALELWAKGDRDFTANNAASDEDDATDRRADASAYQERELDDLDAMGVDELLLTLDRLAESQGQTYEQFTARWRESLGGLDVGSLDTIPRDIIATQIRKIRAYINGKNLTP